MSSGTFQANHFAEGRFRLAYKGTYTGPPSKYGQECVVKKNKESYTWEPTDWDMSVKIQERAQKLATLFNKEHNCTRSIKFTEVKVCKVIKSDYEGQPKLNEYVIVEDYIPGNFTKWCNNYGFVSAQSELMPAFMHWSWVHTGGQEMIADLQGVRDDNTYHLTDPVLMSNTNGGKFGTTDTGVEGIAMFFLHHSCNQFCQHLKKPTIRDVITNPQAMRQVKQLQCSTAYAHELKIPKDIRQTMITVFPQIATRYY